MQVTETVSEGLKRELKVVINADVLDSKLSERLEDLKGRVQIKGFRPGKVPVAHLKRVYGRSVMAEIIQETVNETTKQALSDRDERPAFEPTVSLPEDEQEVEQIIAGKHDLSFTLGYEIFPAIELVNLEKVELEKDVADITDEEKDETIQKLLENHKTYKAKDAEAEDGDQVTIDFVGKIDGEAFEGGSAEDAPVVIGQNAFIPGFEQGLIGVKAGDEKNLDIEFPEDYSSAQLAGKPAVFEVKVKEVAAPETAELTDEFVKTLGLESVDDLREKVSEQLVERNKDASQMKLKHKVLDVLNDEHMFELPQTMVDREFDAIWEQLTSDMEKHKKTFEDDDTTEEEQKKKFREIAERRVRLWFVFSEIGEKNEIDVSEDEIKAAMFERAKQFPGQEQQILEWYKQNPEQVMQLRTPIYENKIVDFVVALAKVTENKVSTEDLLKFDHEEQ